MVTRLAALALVTSLSLSCSSTAEACAPAPPPGTQVEIAEEEAVIIWDAEHKIEHFIRKAEFMSSARAFGFLVPTPTVPELGEVSNDVFPALAEALRPEIKYEKKGFSFRVEPAWCMATRAAATDDAIMRPQIRVISTQHVAGFDASVLEADNTAALTSWLATHGFEATPALTAWLEGYVAGHWKITAFVVATDEKDPDGANRYNVATRSVRMSFSTDKPFYPYREPAATSQPQHVTDRLLRVFFLAKERFAATMGSTSWSAQVVLAAPLAVPSELAPLAGAKPFATVFNDASSPRRGLDEVFFAPSADHAEIHIPPVIIVEPHTLAIPIEAILLPGVVLVIWWIARRRRR